jgi:hypothetical protein
MLVWRWSRRETTSRTQQHSEALAAHPRRSGGGGLFPQRAMCAKAHAPAEGIAHRRSDAYTLPTLN